MPATLETLALRKRYAGGNGADPAALEGLTHRFAPGKITAVLGPSGSGKSTTLGLLAGLLAPDSGRVLLDGRDITGSPAERRGFGLMFQNYALFPHLTVEGNVAFGLRVRGVPRAERAVRVRETLELVRIPQLAVRRVGELSGGEQQRVALARALAFQPPVLLMDEPLSALDAKLRDELRADLHALLRRLAVTTVYVTHDQVEALALGDELVILHRGRVEQVGAPREVYARPANVFVAGFLGSANVLPAERVAGGALRLAFTELPAPANGVGSAGPLGRCRVMIRPEDITVAASPAEGQFQGRVESAVFLGQRLRLTVRAPGATAEGTALLVDVGPHQPAALDAVLPLRLDPARVVVWNDVGA